MFFTFSKKKIISLSSVHTLKPEYISSFFWVLSKMKPEGIVIDKTTGPDTLKSFLQFHLKDNVIRLVIKSKKSLFIFHTTHLIKRQDINFCYISHIADKSICSYVLLNHSLCRYFWYLFYPLDVALCTQVILLPSNFRSKVYVNFDIKCRMKKY